MIGETAAVEGVTVDEDVVSGAGSGWFGEWSWWSDSSSVVGIFCKLGSVFGAYSGAGSRFSSFFGASAW